MFYTNNYAISRTRYALLKGRCAILIWAIGLTVSCKSATSYSTIGGKIFGTTYTIKADIPLEDLTNGIDSVLEVVDHELSTYKSSSFISQVNQAPSNDTIRSWPVHFKKNLTKAIELYEASDHFYDVSVMPLVNYWGFGYTPKKPIGSVDSLLVDSIMQFVGLEKWSIDLPNEILIKRFSHQQLDFSSLAKGYAVDLVSQYLIEQNSQHHMVEIGGEIIVKGQNSKGEPWVLGINYPDEDASVTDFMRTVSLSNKAMASSGNYRNFYFVDGRKYGHTINPITGYPHQDELLAVTVIAQDCLTADALATACMAMGYERAHDFINNLRDVDALFLVGQPNGEIIEKFTDGFIQHQ